MSRDNPNENGIGAISAMMSWMGDAVAFTREALGVEKLDPWQERALRILSGPEPLVRLALVACKGPGKSFVLACAALWWFATRLDAQVICTSITGKNLKDGLWKEILGLFQRSELLRSIAEVRAERIIMKPRADDAAIGSRWFISARSWAQDADQSAQESTLAGLHGPAMMYLGDEVGDYPAGVLAAADAMAANVEAESECRIVVAGNPTDVAGPLYPIQSRFRDKWNIINITGDPDDPERSSRVSSKWAREQIEMYGRDHPFVRVNILGLFPLTALNTLLSPDEVTRATFRKISLLDYHWVEKRLSVDVARFGDDRTVIMLRQGVKAGPFVEMQGASNQDVAARVALAVQRTGASIVIIDADGVGGGVFDALQVAGVKCHAVHSAGKPMDPRYYNRRAEMWSQLAEWVKDRGWLPQDNMLMQDLMAPKYTIHKGKILIEEKEEIKRRLGRSPDRGDAAALSFALPDGAQIDPLLSLAMMQNKARGAGGREWDPVVGKLTAEKGGADYDPFGRF